MVPARGQLRTDRGLHLRPPVTHQVGAIGAHVVDMLVAIDVPRAECRKPGEELREIVEASSLPTRARTCRSAAHACPLHPFLIARVAPGHRTLPQNRSTLI